MKVCIVGGGTGLSNIISGFRDDKNVELTAITTASDDGSDTGRLVHEYGLPGYIGDLMKCYLALAHNTDGAAMLAHRWGAGSRKGNALRNDFLGAGIKSIGLEKTLEQIRKFLGIYPNHTILPVATEPTELCALLKNGKVIHGESNIAIVCKSAFQDPEYEIDKVFLNPSVTAYAPAVQAVRDSTRCVVACGDLFTSILPVFLAEGMEAAMRDFRHKILLILNLMIRDGETDNFRAEHFIERIERGMGRPCDVILHSSYDKRVSSEVRIRYQHAHMVSFSAPISDPRVVRTPLRMSTPQGTLVHDPVLTRKAIKKASRILENFEDSLSVSEKLGEALAIAFQPFKDPEATSPEQFTPVSSI